MNKSVYARPNKPLTVTVHKREPLQCGSLFTVPDIITVDKGSECHVTPKHVADIMADLLISGPVLEPSAGTGNLVQAAIDAGCTHITAIERNYRLAGTLEKYNIEVLNMDFFEYQPESKFRNVIMNPPFSHVKQHMQHALSMCNGVLIALVPITYQHQNAELIEILPADTFSTAKVNTKIIRFTQF